jgi:hypothetical protein
VDGDRVENALHGRPMLVTDREWVVGHALHHLERVAALAAILVNRHGTLSIGVPNFPAASPNGHETAQQMPECDLDRFVW